MNKIWKLGVRSILALGCTGILLFAAGCGDGSNVTTGAVVKGPVSGATVTDARGKIATTGPDGRFSIDNAIGDFTSHLGTYVPVSAPTTTRTAPDMATPAGSVNITPLTTIAARTLPADRAAVITQLNNFGVPFNSDLSTKTFANTKALAVSEAVGESLFAAGINANALIDVLSAAFLNTNIIKPVPTSATFIADLATFISNAASTSGVSGLVASAAAINAAATAAGNAAIALPLGPLPTVITTPAPFSFTAQTGVALNTVITSNAITVAGINASAPISITGGSYSITGGTYTSIAGTVTNGQTVTVRHTSSAANGTATTTTLTIGGVSAAFTSTTVGAAGVITTPTAFSFTAQTGVALSAVITSNAITVAGINAPSPISVIGGTYSINGGTFTAATGTVTNGQTVAVRHTSSAANSTATTTTLTIGGVSAAFTSTTVAAGVIITPNAFSFTAQTGVALSTLITSNTITVTGINAPSPISVIGGTYSINGGTFTAATGTVTNNQTVAVQHTSSAVNSTVTTTTLTIGGVSGAFTSTTVAAAINGAALYGQFCAGCHGALTSATRQHIGATVAQINLGITNNSGGMGVFASTGATPLSAAQIAAISVAMQ